MLNPKQFQQLPMFMSAREIVADTKLYDRDRGQSTNRLMTQKRRASETKPAFGFGKDSSAGSLAENIRAQGVVRPLEIEWKGSRRPELVNGHHRLSVMLEHAPDQPLPVVHETDRLDFPDKKFGGWTY